MKKTSRDDFDEMGDNRTARNLKTPGLNIFSRDRCIQGLIREHDMWNIISPYMSEFALQCNDIWSGLQRLYVHGLVHWKTSTLV